MKHSLLRGTLLLAAALLLGSALPAAHAGGPYPVGPPRGAYGPPGAWGPYGAYRGWDPFFFGWGLTWVIPVTPMVFCTPLDCPPPPPRPPRAGVPPPEPVYVPSGPDPVITPRNGQGWQQTEADRQACNRLATQDQAALLDAQVFQNSVAACMDARGYTVK